MLRKVFWYGLVGASGILVNVMVLTGARWMWPRALTLTYLLAVEVSIVTNYWLNARLTFKQNPNLRALIQYNLVMSGGGIIQTAVYRVLLYWNWQYVLADLVAIPFATAFGFLLSNNWVFRGRERMEDGSHDRVSPTAGHPQCSGSDR